MHLKHLSILNYKNIEEADLTLSPKINCFIGNNGEGKTNLLDAVYYLSFCKSHTNTMDIQNITHGKDFFMINGTYEKDGTETQVYCGYKPRQKKQFKRDKKDYEKISDHIGLIPLVIVSPGDSSLINGGSEERRKFLDRFISQYDKQYLTTLIAYNKALSQRNAMLKAEKSDPLLYAVVEEQMNDFAYYIYGKRTEFIQRFIPYFQQFHAHVSCGKEIVGLKYVSQLCNNEKLLDQLCSNRQRDMLLGYTTRGIHKDDLEMTMEGELIKKIGSQGQCKTYLTALKLAQFDFLCKVGGSTPILILDDIFDKLDSQRVEQIISLMRDNRFGQVFISDTDRQHISNILQDSGCQYNLYTMVNGSIAKESIFQKNNIPNV